MSIPPRIKKRLENLVAGPVAISHAIARSRQLGPRYAAETWANHRERLMKHHDAINAAVNSIPCNDRRQAVVSFLSSRLPAGFITDEEAAYLREDECDIGLPESLV